MDRNSLAILETFDMWPEVKTGWGITKDPANNILYISDSTEFITKVDASTLKVIGTLTVMNGSRPMAKVNEMEFIYGYLWGNVFGKSDIVKIDPSTGQVVSSFDMSDLTRAERNFVRNSPDTLLSYSGYDYGNNVFNGIAYDFENDDMYVTGKRWNMMFKLKVPEAIADGAYYRGSSDILI